MKMAEALEVVGRLPPNCRARMLSQLSPRTIEEPEGEEGDASEWYIFADGALHRRRSGELVPVYTKPGGVPGDDIATVPQSDRIILPLLDTDGEARTAFELPGISPDFLNGYILGGLVGELSPVFMDEEYAEAAYYVVPQVGLPIFKKFWEAYGVLAMSLDIDETWAVLFIERQPGFGPLEQDEGYEHG